MKRFCCLKQAEDKGVQSFKQTQSDRLSDTDEEIGMNKSCTLSLEDELEELESDKQNFQHVMVMLLQECVSKDVMCMYRIASSTTQTRAPQLNQTFRNTNPCASTSTGIAHKTNVSRPQPRSNQMKDKVVQYTSHAKLKKTEVEEHLGFLTGQCITAVQFVTKLSSLFALAMINFAPILGYGDLIQGIFIHIRTVVYLLRRTHSSASFPVGQFCDAELGALVISVRTEFLKQPLNASLKKQEFEHKILSTPRTPEQNGVVERRNRTLVEAARTMLSASKLPLFFWAEAIATACYTQNRSIIIPTHEKTDSHFNEEKWDSCILVGYSHLSQRDIVYSTNNKAEVKSIHLSIDESKRISETSPDIVQALCYCARYQARPTEKHRKRGIKGLSILKEVHSHGLWYPEGDKLVSWMSKNQDCTAMSSAKAEYVALSASLISNEMRTPLQEYCINYNKIPLSYALSWKPCQGDSLNLPDHRIHKDGDGDASFQLESNSLPHAHAQTTKTYYKHQDSRIMKAQELKTKTSAQTLILKITPQKSSFGGDC
ncbi:retrovirus-related pol polyprotein from transposon TNT 1-94 [Tanacetum coccineum]